MATDFTEETATAAVVDSFARTPDLRLREVLSSLVRHLHDFVRDVEPTQVEWERVITFLTATGQMCDDTWQEFILLSDVLGVAMPKHGAPPRGLMRGGHQCRGQWHWTAFQIVPTLH